MQASTDPIPPILLLPGWLGSGPDHWQSRWEAAHGDRRVEQSDWNWPLRGDWMARLDEAVREAARARPTESPPQPGRRVRLAAHSLGCHLVAAWAAHTRQASCVGAALLVAPPDLEREGVHPALQRWRPVVRQRLPFPSLVVASDDDPFADLDVARALAADWGATVRIEPGRGHLNAESGLGGWPQARDWLLAL
jgi:hypothetical protein